MGKEDQIIAALGTIKSSIRHIRRRSMRLGRYVNDVLETTVNVSLPANYVWVFDPQGDKRVSSPAKNLTTEYGIGMAVIVAYNVDTQEDDVIGVDTVLAPLENGAAAAGLNSPRKPATMPTPVMARDIVTGGLYPDSANNGLNVRIASFWHAGGRWQDEPFTLTPTATSNKKSFVCVGIDPATNTTYTALTTDRALSATLIMNGEIVGAVTDTDSAAADIWAVLSADPQIIWAGAVELAHGATVINPAKIIDLRLWMYPTYAGATISADGIPGLVPAAASADKDKFLKGDGTYDTPVVTSTAPAFGAGVTKTLSSDVASAGSDRHLIIAAQSGTADDLIEITGLTVGEEVIIRADAGDTITVKHNAGGATDKILLYSAADLVLSGDKTLKLAKTESGKVVQYVDEKTAGSGLSISYLGYNTAGGSTETMTRYRQLMKQITAPSDGVILNVGAYIKPSAASNVMGFSVAVLADNAGSPDEIISLVPWHAVYSAVLDNSYRWVSIPMSLPVTAGDYWIAISDVGNGSRLHIAYDGSGGDKYWATGNPWMTGTDGGYSLTSTTNKYSLRAGFLA
ncbi:MAG: hypothetical protein E6R03_08665 [Hyphomicrobiaceae bacterium]|nr:MAG: hypothetical protein E6R03_08665 [Hyphomicrobiaceae bacterium]